MTSQLDDLQKLLNELPKWHDWKDNPQLMFNWLEKFERLFSAFQTKYDGQVHVSREQVSEMVTLLEEVVEMRGAYSQNHLTHAENVIENASERAKKVTDNLKELLEPSKKKVDVVEEMDKFERNESLEEGSK